MIERLPVSTRRIPRFAALAALIMFATLASLHGAQAADTDEFSRANRLLFMTDHLANVDTPAQLSYRFAHESQRSEDSYDDTIELDVSDGDGPGKQVHVEFFSGDRHRYVPDVAGAKGNPVVMMFLQNDVISMARHTGGSWRYWQRQVKLALENQATVTQDTADYDGRDIAVERIVMQPFTQEKTHREALAGAVNKRYVITLSEAVPGGILEMRSEVPNADADDNAIVERLQLASVKHAELQPNE